MANKKVFKIYYLVASEGQTEFNLFAYLKNRFSEFKISSIRFSNKIEILEAGISGGILNGVNGLKGFKSKNELIKQKYPEQHVFYLLDKDFEDSEAIADVVKKQDGDVVQFVEYNSEYFLLKLAGEELKEPKDFENNMAEFRTYCKSSFEKHFGKSAVEMKDIDFDFIFDRVDAVLVKQNLRELFNLIENS